MTEVIFVFSFLAQQYLFSPKSLKQVIYDYVFFFFFNFYFNFFLMRGLVDNSGLGISNDHIFLLQSTRERIRYPTDLFFCR